MSDEIKYEPKFKVGHTLNFSRSGCEGEDDLGIVIGTYNSLRQYVASGNLIPHSDYDESSSGHTIYYIYNLSNSSFSWKWEFRGELYCSNQIRGRNILLQMPTIDLICSEREIQGDNKIRFIQSLKELG